MYFQPSTTALAIIALAPLAACEGINCEGSGACSFVAPGLQEIANSLQSFPNAGFYPTGGMPTVLSSPFKSCQSDKLT